MRNVSIPTLLASALVLAGAAFIPSAVASQVYFEDFEGALGGWAVTGATGGQDCARSYSGSCSLALTPACCSAYVWARDPVAIPLAGVTVVTFRFMASAASGDTDSGFEVLLDTGAVLGEITYWGSAGNDGVSINSAGGGSHLGFASWGSANSWHTLDLVFDPSADTVRAVVDGASSNTLSIPPTASTITQLGVYAVEWGGSFIRFNYDAVAIDSTGLPQCSDGVDNDADGRTDYPSDPGCSNAADTTESPNPACSDGVDNDADGAADYPADRSCSDPRDVDEASPAQCGDGYDNDGDGATDYPNDPGCASALDNTESPNPVCSDGLDNDGDTLADYPADPGCSDVRDGDEREGVSTPFDVPSQGATQPVPALSTPHVAPQSVTTPPVIVPATCTLPVCEEETTTPEETVTTPEVEPITHTTDPVTIDQCVPLAFCVGPFTIPPQTVGPTSGVGSHSVTVPSQTVPALCSVASAACLPAVTILAPVPVTTPEVGSVPLTPAVTVSASTTGFSGFAGVHVDQSTAIGPFTVEVPTPFGPFPVTLCPSGCPAPVDADASLEGSVIVVVTIGADTFAHTLPVDL